MTLQTQDIKILEDLIRKVVREEIRNAVKEVKGEDNEFATEEEFRAAAATIFKTHKRVLDALA
jgi:hypothetical protein